MAAAAVVYMWTRVYMWREGRSGPGPAGLSSGCTTSASSAAASSPTASRAQSRTLACASPIFSSSAGTSPLTPLCTSRGPSAGPMDRTAAVSSLHDEANTLATLSLNRRLRLWHSARKTSFALSPTRS